MSKALATNDNLVTSILSDPLYSIDRNGTILTLRDGAGHIKTVWRKASSIQRNGYRAVWYKGKHVSVHRIVYAKFVGPLDQELVVNHKDGDPGNNCADNLELVSQAANNLHKYRVLGKNGVKGNSVINFTIAESIRLLKTKYNVSHEDLTKIFKVTKSSVSAIVNGKIWKTE